MMRSGLKHFPEDELALLSKAARWPEHPAFESMTSDSLCQVTKREGVDFATALLFDRLCNSPKHTRLIQRLDALREPGARTEPGIDARVVVVPGALYHERPDLGGDGRLVREVAESLGFKTGLIPVASFGSVTTNARIIRAWLQQQHREPLILVSLSKGGADLKAALSEPGFDCDLNSILAWVNVCGPLTGSRMANWILESRWRTWFFRLKFRAQGRDFKFITDLQAGSKGMLSSSAVLPVRPITLIGFPLRRHMTTPLSRFCHRTLSRYGPNDGTTSLSDLQLWPGGIYPVWGMDHYFRPASEARKLISAVLHYLAAAVASSEPVHTFHSFHELPA